MSLLKSLCLAGVIISSTIAENPKDQIKNFVPVNSPIYSIEKELLSQIGNTWEKIYNIRYNGKENLTIKKEDVTIEIFGKNLSNSELKPHVYPITTNPIKHNLRDGNFFSMPVIKKINSDYRCDEIIEFEIKKINSLEDLFDKENKIKNNEFELKNGDKFQSIIKIKHNHFLYGSYSPLLGTRVINLYIGPEKIHDEIVLKKEINPLLVLPKINQPLEERVVNSINGKNGRFLYIRADVPGYQYYRFDDIPVKFGDKFSFNFDYIIASGTEGKCYIRIMEYKDTPNVWYRLDYGFDEELKTIGKWTNFERELNLSNNTTTIAMDFRIVGSEVGLMYVDLESLKVKNLKCDNKGYMKK